MPQLRSPILLLALIACGGEGAACLARPCPEPLAISVSISSAASGVGVAGAAVEVSGAVTTNIPCSSSCAVFGSAGTYDITISAPGFASVHRTIQVSGTTPRCGCAMTTPEHIAIALTASPA